MTDSLYDQKRANIYKNMATPYINILTNLGVCYPVRKTIDKLLTRHSLVVKTVQHSFSVTPPEVTISEIESAVLDLDGSRFFPSTIYTPNPITYTEFKPLMPNILKGIWKEDNGSACPNFATDVDVLSDTPSVGITASELASSMSILNKFIQLDVSYLIKGDSIVSANREAKQRLQALIDLEPRSIITKTPPSSGSGSSSGGDSTPPEPIKEYKPEFKTQYSAFLQFRKSQIATIQENVNVSAEEIHSNLRFWIEVYVHRVEGVLGKTKMTQMSVDVQEESLRMLTSKHDFFQISEL